MAVAPVAAVSADHVHLCVSGASRTAAFGFAAAKLVDRALDSFNPPPSLQDYAGYSAIDIPDNEDRRNSSVHLFQGYSPFVLEGSKGGGSIKDAVDLASAIPPPTEALESASQGTGSDNGDILVSRDPWNAFNAAKRRVPIKKTEAIERVQAVERVGRQFQADARHAAM